MTPSPEINTLDNSAKKSMILYNTLQVQYLLKELLDQHLAVMEAVKNVEHNTTTTNMLLSV